MNERQLLNRFRLFMLLFKMVTKQTYIKVTAFSGGHFEFIKTPQSIRNKICVVKSFFQRIWEYDNYIAKVCRQSLDKVVSQGVKEIAVYGAGNIARILYVLTEEMPLKITAVYDDIRIKRFSGFKALPVEALIESNEKIVIGALVGIEDRAKRLKEIGIPEKRLVILK